MTSGKNDELNSLTCHMADFLATVKHFGAFFFTETQLRPQRSENNSKHETGSWIV